jgi:hypothetical protein
MVGELAAGERYAPANPNSTRKGQAADPARRRDAAARSEPASIRTDAPHAAARRDHA